MSSCQMPPLSVFVLTDHSYQEQTALAFLGVYLDALRVDEELLALLTSSTHKPGSTTIKVEELK
jgi:hypothetical protein